MSTGWDSNMLKKLKSLVGRGLSTSEMGKKLGMSKNAVVGKLNRMGWNSGTTDDKSKKTDKTAKKVATKTAVKTVAKKTTEKAKTTTKKVAKPAPKVAEKTVAPTPKTPQIKPIKTASKKTKKDLALHELLIQHALQMANLKQNQCRWPIGDPDSENFHFCGETVFSGKPYCYEHCRQAYQFTPPKKK